MKKALITGIIGQDGAVLAIDLVSGGFGFQSQPHIDVKDN